jgi:hypothetical protein
MRLTEFRIRGFRCIHDTQVVPVSETAVLIGKNESGKTAILAALAHLNRERGINPDDLCDDLVDELNPDDRIVEGLFELTAAEREFVARQVPEVSNVTHLRIFRTKGGSGVDYEFPAALFPKKFSPNEHARPAFLESIKALTRKLHDEIAHLFETEPDAKVRAANTKALKSDFDAVIAPIPGNLEYKSLESQLDKLNALTVQYFKAKPSIMGTMGAVKKAFQGVFFLNDRRWKLKQFVLTNLHPRLIYFPEYKVIDGIIDVEQYLKVQEVPEKRTDIGYQFQKAETIRNLFHLAEVDPSKLSEMAANQTRLNSELVRSSQRLTRMLALTWKAKKIGVRLNYSDGCVTVVVSDIFADGTTKNEGLLDRRSAGFKWHFSFYVNFRAGIQQKTFKDAILLLDEPGLNLHPEQQGGLVDVIRDLSLTNQVLYTTHSPFMIYNFDRGNLLIIEFDPQTKTSRIQQNFWDGDPQTIRPVLHSIGDRMLLNVFAGSEILAAILAVEGITDQRYLVTVAELGLTDDQGSRLEGAEPIPSGGHTQVRERAIHYHKRRKKVAALFDNDPEALQQATLLEKHFPKDAIVRLAVGGKPEAEIEDVFTEDDYLKGVNGFYSAKLRDAKNFSDITKRDLKKAGEEIGSPRIVKSLEYIFARHAADNWGAFDKQGVCNFLCDAFSAGEFSLSVKTKERFDALFSQIKMAIDHSGPVSKRVRQK